MPFTSLVLQTLIAYLYLCTIALTCSKKEKEMEKKSLRLQVIPVGYMLLSCKRGSMSSSLPGAELIPCVPLTGETRMLQVFTVTVRRSGIKQATSNARRTVQAPNRKGGPGITDLYKKRFEC